MPAAPATADRLPAETAGRAARRRRSVRRCSRAPAGRCRRRRGVGAAAGADRGRDRRLNSSIDWFWQTRQRNSWLRARARASSAGSARRSDGSTACATPAPPATSTAETRRSRRIIAAPPPIAPPMSWRLRARAGAAGDRSTRRGRQGLRGSHRTRSMARAGCNRPARPNRHARPDRPAPDKDRRSRWSRSRCWSYGCRATGYQRRSG